MKDSLKYFFFVAFLLIAGNVFSQNIVKLNQDQKDEFVREHNKWRADVGTSDLIWSEELASYSAKWAEELGKKCKMKHRPNSGKWEQLYGENIYWTSAPTATPKQSTDAWGEEIEFYPKSVPFDYPNKYGHYTQMVWRNTKRVGCAIVECGDDKGVIIVCNYDPSGNWMEQKAY